MDLTLEVNSNGLSWDEKRCYLRNANSCWLWSTIDQKVHSWLIAKITKNVQIVNMFMKM